tara:strand:- start:2466 stop:2888 length:423 start_codon:yes stop_codon:yes gene_type:complete
MDKELPILIGDGLSDNQVKFINAYVNHYCNISKACAAIDITRQAYYRWVKEVDTFRIAVDQAKEALKDRWEDEINKQVFEDRNPIVLNKFAPMVLKDRGYADIKDVKLHTTGQQENNVVITVVDSIVESIADEEEVRVEH